MKRICLVLAFLFAAIALASCGSGSDSDVIKIGVNYELSKDVATYGQSSVEGIELAIEQINEAGGVNGKKIKLIKYDNESNPSIALTLTTRLMTQDKVVAVLGPATSGAFGSTIPLAMQHKIPIASGSATADGLLVDENGNVKEYAFRICFNDSYQGRAMANFALNNLKKTKAVIIKDNSSDYGKGLAENFKKTFTDNGGTIVAEEAYVKNEVDFNAILTGIKGKDFDVIFIPGYYNEAGLIIKQARAMGIDVPILGADGFDSPELVNLAGEDALNDVYFSNHYSPLDESPVVVDFIESFKKKYNKEPDAFNALGYDLANFVVDGIKRAESLTGKAVKDALEATKDFEGVTGSFSIDENHDPVKALIIIELQNGKQVSTIRAGN
ncbi:MAG TPA: ABC transporter substrate-binding protein [Candidatus Atribacteria bacterium]|nr:ABC transporter substrate-binding protein [Candidatus Atribacteria bacterium]